MGFLDTTRHSPWWETSGISQTLLGFSHSNVKMALRVRSLSAWRDMSSLPIFAEFFFPPVYNCQIQCRSPISARDNSTRPRIKSDVRSSERRVQNPHVIFLERPTMRDFQSSSFWTLCVVHHIGSQVQTSLNLYELIRCNVPAFV